MLKTTLGQSRKRKHEIEILELIQFGINRTIKSLQQIHFLKRFCDAFQTECVCSLLNGFIYWKSKFTVFS